MLTTGPRQAVLEPINTTLKKVKLVSRTVRLVHREAEGSWLALQLLLAQGVWRQTERMTKQELATAKPLRTGSEV